MFQAHDEHRRKIKGNIPLFQEITTFAPIAHIRETMIFSEFGPAFHATNSNIPLKTFGNCIQSMASQVMNFE
jgi:hypothetical protein